MNILAIEKTGDIRNAKLDQLAVDLKQIKMANPAFAAEICREFKDRWRQDYFKNEQRVSGLDVDAVRGRSSAFWQRYELLNRVFDPSDPVYSIVKAATALSTTADLLTFKAAASGQGRILELIIGGEAVASAVNRVNVQQENATLASNGAITPEKFNSRSPAAAGTYGAGNTSAALAGAMLVFAINAFGGFIRWVAAPGEEMYYVNGEVIGVRSASGTSTVSATGIFEEL
jgi:hypothetical protein